MRRIASVPGSVPHFSSSVVQRVLGLAVGLFETFFRFVSSIPQVFAYFLAGFPQLAVRLILIRAAAAGYRKSENHYCQNAKSPHVYSRSILPANGEFEN
jgi:hypothetical protein